VNIKAICKRKYGLIPNAVSVVAQDGKYKFYDLRNRDAVYELLQAAWRAVVPNADALQKQYDMGENGTMPSLHEDANDNLRADMPLEPVSDVEEDSESLLSNTSSSTPPNERVTRPPMSDKPKAQTPPLTISISAGRDSPVENEGTFLLFLNRRLILSTIFCFFKRHCDIAHPSTGGPPWTEPYLLRGKRTRTELP